MFIHEDANNHLAGESNERRVRLQYLWRVGDCLANPGRVFGETANESSGVCDAVTHGNIFLGEQSDEANLPPKFVFAE
jgi:hypothetical protein